MDAFRKKDTILAFLVVGIALAWIVYQSGLFSVVSIEFPVRGVVVAVTGSGEAREALVKLDEGGEVKAAVPAHCIVFPGYLATVYHSGRPFSGAPKYSILSATEKE